MSIPSLPHWQPQGPDSRCVIAGKALGWENCTPTSVAMAIDRSTLGAKRPSGCDVRDAIDPPDVAGGTTLPQCAAVARRLGVAVDVYVGSNVVPPFWTAVQAQAGRSFVLQGNTAAILSTSHRSTGGPVNHAVFVAGVRGGSQGEPAEGLVYDPAADGRSASWGRAAQGPQWWSWGDIKRFAAALHPWGDGDPRVLGPGKFYTALFPDTEPHVHLRYGGVKTSPFPDAMTAWRNDGGDYVNFYPKPDHQTTKPSGRIRVGASWNGYQRTSGSLFNGSRRWYGDHNGTRWIHSYRLRGEG